MKLTTYIETRVPFQVGQYCFAVGLVDGEPRLLCCKAGKADPNGTNGFDILKGRSERFRGIPSGFYVYLGDRDYPLIEKILRGESKSNQVCFQVDDRLTSGGRRVVLYYRMSVLKSPLV